MTKSNYKTLVARNIPLMYLYSAFSKAWIYLPVQIIFFSQITESYTKAMGIITFGNIITTVLELPTGCLSDKFGRKRICSLGAFCMFLALLLWSFSTSFTSLIAGSFFYGAFYALSSGNNEALIYETLLQLHKKNSSYKIMSKFYAIGQFSLAISAIICTGLMFISIRSVMLSTTIMMFFAFYVTLFLIEPKHYYTFHSTGFKHIKQAVLFLWKNKKLRYYGLAEIFQHGLSEGGFYFNSIYFKLFIPEWSLGIFRSIGHFFDSLGSYISHLLHVKFSEIKIAQIGSFSSNIINICSVLAASFLSPILKIGSSFAMGVNTPAAEIVWQKNIHSFHRVTIRSIVSLLKKLSFALFSFLIGYIADLFTPYFALLFAYILAFFTNFLYTFAEKEK